MVDFEHSAAQNDEALTQLLAELGVDPALLGILKTLKVQTTTVTIQDLAEFAETQGRDVGELVDNVAHLVDTDFVEMKQTDNGNVELKLTQRGIDFLEPV